jgi:dihydroorotate dehydrogenase (fumarate)
MPNLDTKYLNLNLKNPIIVGSSGLTSTAEKIVACEKSGAGAVVVKSLFEEVLAGQDWGLDQSAGFHPEALDYLTAELQMQYAPNPYCDLISEAKEKTKIPVIGSINCISTKWWPEFAKKIEYAGADALELNVFSIPNDPEISSATIENMYLEILEKVKETVTIPVAMKIGGNFTSLPYMLSQLDKRGVDGIVMFNRFTEPDIDLKKLKLKTTFSFSTEDEIHTQLRWVAITADTLNCDISATTGIHSAEGIIKLILAGASTVQLASVLYKNGLKIIDELLKNMEDWMTKYKIDNIEQMKGRLSFSPNFNPEMYFRAQFMEKIRGVE